MTKRKAVWGSPRWVDYRGARELTPAMFVDHALTIRLRLLDRTYYESAPSGVEGRCALYRGPINADGYGRFHVRKSEGGPLWVYVHRLALVLAGASLGIFDEVDHFCLRRACWEPLHLRVLTDPENRALVGRDERTGRFANGEIPV